MRYGVKFAPKHQFLQSLSILNIFTLCDFCKITFIENVISTKMSILIKVDVLGLFYEIITPPTGHNYLLVYTCKNIKMLGFGNKTGAFITRTFS